MLLKVKLFFNDLTLSTFFKTLDPDSDPEDPWIRILNTVCRGEGGKAVAHHLLLVDEVSGPHDQVHQLVRVPAPLVQVLQRVLYNK